MSATTGSQATVAPVPIYSVKLQDLLTGIEHMNLTGRVQKNGRVWRAGGGHYDVYCCQLEGSSSKVAVRQLRIYVQNAVHDFAKVPSLLTS